MVVVSRPFLSLDPYWTLADVFVHAEGPLSAPISDVKSRGLYYDVDPWDVS